MSVVGVRLSTCEWMAAPGGDTFACPLVLGRREASGLSRQIDNQYHCLSI